MKENKDNNDPPSIKVTDRRHFDISGEKRPSAESTREEQAEPAAPATGSKPGQAPGSSGGSAAGERSGQTGRQSEPRPAPGGPSLADSTGEGSHETPSETIGDLAEMAMRLSSSFSLLVARLAQETEIYLGLVPYPGKETAEPDLEAARAMIDMLSMLQEKTRGNLDAEESHLLENLLYNYRLEFVRRRSGG